jgi:GNAT superfamily N-acetyltransferase
MRYQQRGENDMDYKIRKAIIGEEKDIVHVNIQTWKTAYAGIVDDDFLKHLDENSPKRFSSIQKDIVGGQIYVALNDDKIVGIAIFGKARDDDFSEYGELYALYVLDAYQRAGIGRMLVNAVKNELKLEGYKHFIIACLSQNPSCNFYEKIGGKMVTEKSCTIGGKNYMESIFSYDILA